MSDINIKITDRNGVTHEVVAPTDMSMNLMEIIRSYELAEEGTIGVCGGMAMCASCQVYVINDPGLIEMGDEERYVGRGFSCKRKQQIGLPASHRRRNGGSRGRDCALSLEEIYIKI